MGMILEVNLFESGSGRLYARIFERLREIELRMSAHWLETEQGGALLFSEVAEIGRQAGVAPVRVGPDLIELLSRALFFAEISGGAFDPTIGPLTELWEAGIPGAEEIGAALRLVNWRELEVDRVAGTAFLRRPGMSLDLGGMVKGYAADEAARLAREAGAGRALMDFGGDIVALGQRQSRDGALQRLFSRRVSEDLPWRIGIQRPFGEPGTHVAVIEARDSGISTSAAYGIHAGAGLVLSPETGMPPETGLLSVTVIAGSAADADGLSTAALVMGYARARAMIDSLPGVEAVFLFDNMSVRITGALAGIFRLTSGDFSLAL